MTALIAVIAVNAALVAWSADAALAQSSPPIPVAAPPVSVVNGDGAPATEVPSTSPASTVAPVSAASTVPESITTTSLPTTPPTTPATTLPSSTAPATRPSKGGVPTTTAPATSVAELRARIDAAMATATAGSIGALVVADTDTALYDRSADVPRVPASTQKLYVAATALARLGPSHRFVTEVRASGPITTTGALIGDLVLRAGGDPSLTTAQLRSLADGVLKAGVRTVQGGLVVDDARFDAVTRIDSWKPTFTPGEVGVLDAFAVDGNHRAATDAGIANLELFRAVLAAKGVTVAGSSARGASPASAPIASVESAPLVELVRHMLKKSDNTYAEMLMKELSATPGPGSTTAGVRTIADHFAKLGVSAPTQIDGSGLSPLNRSSPRQQVEWLRRTADSAFGLRDVLPGACVDGTLRSRMCRTPAAANVVAKTGAIDHVVGLAGYATTASGRRVTFSFLLNDVRSSARSRAAIDAAVVAIASALL